MGGVICQIDGSEELSVSKLNPNELRDYKFFCFNGSAKFYKVDFNRFVHHQANYYDCNGTILPFGEKIFPIDPNIEYTQPSSISQMIRMAELLSIGIPFLRVDFYNINGKVYFGELTFFPASGLGLFTPDEYNLRLGELISLTGV